ncbi:hypothetical protein HXX76_012986 [Chlamydomonas incerta]|uniref:BTB domain-containing protein n=1 Tax=Chlamydomonas incerta TaxID=51695 RepID=A0A835SJG1_CHLIN|nr:hypothetical protein HXX76_012986 [Chlamydomonas incerta]|eukprot:KAG2426676.1 hypothetical protein HXX76_012986 [Chlamydomonas incerta]
MLHAATEGLDLTAGKGFAWPVWDSWSLALYFFYGAALLRLVGDEVTLVAGDSSRRSQRDGAGPAARLSGGQLVSDGAGGLYSCEGRRIRRIQLPVAWRAAGGSAGQESAAGAAGAAQPAAPAVAMVSTLPYEAPPAAQHEQPGSGEGGQQASNSAGGSGSCGAGWLVFGTDAALYRLQLPVSESVTAGGAAAPAARGARLQAQLLAGCEGESGLTDGQGDRARFSGFSGMTSDAAGNVYLAADNLEEGDGPCVRRVSPSGVVTTLVTTVPQNRLWSPFILPNGYLAMGAHSTGGKFKLLLIDLGLTPVLPQWRPAADDAPASAARRSLPADLGALLDAQPDGTADLTIRVGERRFHVHRAILSARCDYFKQRLAGDAFEDARAAELELPDADPDAFALLLRWLYTGGADVPSEQARGVAELADRLLLPELCAATQGVVAASVTAGTAVDCLLWAWDCSESRDGGGGFGELLARLKEWYVSHHAEVAEVAGASRALLAARAPLLMVELTDAILKQDGRSRKRTRV